MKVTVNDETRTRRVTYIVLGVVFLLLTGTALLFFHSNQESAEADAKADQLLAALASQGLRTPPKDQIVALFGDDGGSVCSDPNNALRHSVLYGQLTNGAGGPGTRPVIADSRAVRGQLLIMKVYCPGELEEFAQFADDLKLDDVAKG
jgi:hypothetical protein